MVDEVPYIRIREKIRIFISSDGESVEEDLDMNIISHKDDDDKSSIYDMRNYRGYVLSKSDSEYYIIRFQSGVTIGFLLEDLSGSKWIWKGMAFTEEFIEIGKYFLEKSMQDRRNINISKIFE